MLRYSRTNTNSSDFFYFRNELPVDLKKLMTEKNIHVVNKNWITESSDANSRLSETTYAIKMAQ